MTPQSGLLYFKEWGACYNGTNNAAGIYQDLSSAPGSTYQASGWFFTRGSDVLGADCYVWIEVSFLGSSSNLLALYKSDNFTASVGTDNWFQYQVTNACNISSPVSIGDPFFNTYAVTGTVSQLVAPVGDDHGPLPVCLCSVRQRGRVLLFRQRGFEPGHRLGPAGHQQPLPAEHDFRQSRVTASASTSVPRAALRSITAALAWSSMG